MNKLTKTPFASQSLTENGQPARFVLKTMQQIASRKPSKPPQPHRHQFYSLIWITGGTGTHVIDYKTYPAVAGTIFFLSPEQVHDLRMDDGHEGYVMLFTSDFLETTGLGREIIDQSGFFFRCDDVAPLTLDREDEKAALLQIIALMESEYRQKGLGYEQAIGALLRLFLLQCQRISARLQPLREERKKAGAQIMKQFKELLENHYSSWHKVADYAQALHLTPNYLNEVVSQESGTSAKDRILARIMLEAKRFATHSDISVKEVAYLLGFEDPAHFSKRFKQSEGLGFTDFRTEFRKKYS